MKTCKDCEYIRINKGKFDWQIFFHALFVFGLSIGLVVGMCVANGVALVCVILVGLMGVIAWLGFGIVAGFEGKKIYEDSNIDEEEKNE